MGQKWSSRRSFWTAQTHCLQTQQCAWARQLAMSQTTTSRTTKVFCLSDMHRCLCCSSICRMAAVVLGSHLLCLPVCLPWPWHVVTCGIPSNSLHFAVAVPRRKAGTVPGSVRPATYGKTLRSFTRIHLQFFGLIASICKVFCELLQTSQGPHFSRLGSFSYKSIWSVICCEVVVQVKKRKHKDAAVRSRDPCGHRGWASVAL